MKFVTGRGIRPNHRQTSGLSRPVLALRVKQAVTNLTSVGDSAENEDPLRISLIWVVTVPVEALAAPMRAPKLILIPRCWPGRTSSVFGV
jgi:hypothetical protein